MRNYSSHHDCCRQPLYIPVGAGPLAGPFVKNLTFAIRTGSQEWPFLRK